MNQSGGQFRWRYHDDAMGDSWTDWHTDASLDRVGLSVGTGHARRTSVRRSEVGS
jgi:hypothetical protein